MELTPRITKILNILLSQDEPISEQEIADQVGVSRRTIIREFEYLESAIKSYDVTLVRKKGTGVWVEASEDKKKALLQVLNGSDKKDWTDKSVRRKSLILKLLQNKEPTKTFTYANEFGVSEATISKDLKAIEGWLLDSHLEIIKKAGYGVVLKGSEENFRHALQRYMNENIKDKEVRSIFTGNEPSDNIYEILNSDYLERVTKTLTRMDEPRLKSMTESSFTGLIMHLTISLDRIMQGEVIESELSEEYKLEDEYGLAVKILKNLEQEFDISIPKQELGYIMLHIKGSKLQYTNQANALYSIGAEEILDIVDQMIDAFDEEIAYELKLDEDFIHGLLVHLEPTFIRLKNKMNIYNPILKDIKEEYPDIFKKCQKASTVITKVTGFEVNDEEVGYLTMHFGAAIERVNNQRRKERCVEIGVICASGFGVARLMLTKLKNQLDKQVNLHAFGKDELTPYIMSKIDFFVTSIDLKHVGVDYLQVSPLIPARDLQKIRIKVDEYARMPLKVEQNDFTRQLDEINFTAAKIKLLLKKYRDIRILADSTFDRMLTIISKEVTNKATASIILKEDILKRESLMSQIFPELKIALLHCRTKAVDEVAFYTCRTKEGTPFLDPYLKQIQTAVVMLMPVDASRKENSQMLGHISSSLLEDDEFLDCIINQNEEKIREKLQFVLKVYFNNYISKI